MILLLDIGNSRIKWCTLESGSLSAGGAVTYSVAGARQSLLTVFEGQSRPEAVWISNVGGMEIETAAVAACQSRWGVSPKFAAAAPEGFGVRNGYRESGQLGVDRWLGLLAVRARFSEPACVANCGTAVTVDLLDAAGTHLGGFIVPGVALMVRSLSIATDGVRVSNMEPPAREPGRSTQECVINGAHAAIAALLDRAVDGLRADAGRPVVCVISGGAADAVTPLMRNACVPEPDLVLRGLALLASGS